MISRMEPIMDFKILSAIVTSLLSGSLVFLGAFSDGNITETGVIIAFVAAGVVAITKFKDFWIGYLPANSRELYSFL